MLSNSEQISQCDETTKRLDPELVEYLLSNFDTSLGISEVLEANLHHFNDALLAYRDYFYSLELWDRVDEVNNYLSKINDILSSK